MITNWHIETTVSLKNLIAQVSEITTDEIIITDKNELILYVNPAFCSLTGFSSDEVIGKKPSLLKSGKHSARFYNKMWEILNRGGVFKRIMINKRKDGTLFYEEKVIVPVKDRNGVIQHYVSTGRDVTQRIELQKDLKKKANQLMKVNADFETFVYKASHDIRGPLASIIGIANMFGREVSDKKALVYCEYVKGCAQNLDEILKNMLHFQVLTGKDQTIAKINIEKIIDRVLHSFATYEGFDKAKIQIVNLLKSDFYSDETFLFSILQNLIHNAVKFRKYGQDADILISVSANRNNVKIKVEDQGLGISKKHFAKLFDMFHRANSTHKGSGLGLYFVKQMVNNLNGKILLESESGKGTKISVVLPNLVSDFG